MKKSVSGLLIIIMMLSLFTPTVGFASDITANGLNFNNITDVPDSVVSNTADFLSVDSEMFADDMFHKGILKLNGSGSAYSQVQIKFDPIKSEGENKYAEIGFDMYTSNVKKAQSNLTLRFNQKIQTVFFANGGKCYIGEKASSDKLLAKTAAFDTGEWKSYRFVFHLTDGSGAPVNKIVAVYEDGNSIMEDIECKFTDNASALQSISFQLSKKDKDFEWSLGIDNFYAASYTSDDGNSLIADKTYLQSGIQEAVNVLEERKNNLTAEEISNFESRIQELFLIWEDVSVSVNSVAEAEKEVKSLIDEIENADSSKPPVVPEPGEDDFNVHYSENFDDLLSMPSGISGTDGLLTIDNSEFASNVYHSGYLKLSGSDDTYSSLNIKFDSIKPEGANKYAEIAFDMYTSGMKSAGSGITLRLGSKVKTMYMSNAGGLYIGENTNGGMLASAMAMDNGSWNNYRIVMQLTDAEGNKINKITQVFENNTDITQNGECSFDEEWAELSQLSMQLSKKSGVYYIGIDNICVASYTSADGISPMYNRSYLITDGERIIKTLNENLANEELYESLKNTVLETAAVYTDKTVTKSAIEDAKNKLQIIINQVNGIIYLKQNPYEVYIPSSELSVSDIRDIEKAYIKTQAVTYKQSYAGNIIAVLSANSDITQSGRILDIISSPVKLEPNSTCIINTEIDLSKYTSFEKENMSITAFVLNDLKSLAFANDNIYQLYGEMRLCDTGNYSFGSDVNAYLKIIDDNNQKVVITVNGGSSSAGKIVSAAVLKKDKNFDSISGEPDESIEYINRVQADKNGCAVFEFSPEERFGVYNYKITSGAFSKEYSGSIMYANKVMIDNAFEAIYSDSSFDNIKKQAGALSLDTELINKANSIGIKVSEIIYNVLQEKKYDALSVDEFSKKTTDILSLLCGIHNAKTVDIMEDCITLYRSYISKADILLQLKPGAVYSMALNKIYSERKNIYDLSALNQVIESGIEKARKEISDNKGTTGGAASGGGGGGSTGGYPKIAAPEEVKDVETPAEKGYAIFKDLDDVPWAHQAISILAAANWINGKAEGIFAPNDNITREEFVKMVVLTFGYPVNEVDTKFTDVSSDAWYAPYIFSAVNAGIINGKNENLFGTGDSITRQEMAAIIYRVLTLKKQGITEDGVYVEFVDEESFADYARDGIIALAKSGIVNGVGGNEFMPEANSTRAEAAKMLCEAYLRIK